jgi:hypothetical protein
MSVRLLFTTSDYLFSIFKLLAIVNKGNQERFKSLIIPKKESKVVNRRTDIAMAKGLKIPEVISSCK